MARSPDRLQEAIVDGYIAQARGWAGDNHWSWTFLTVLLEEAPALGWPILRDIVRQAPDEILAYLGAGPLEDILAEHGFETIEAIEQEARDSQQFRRALAGVWPGRLPAPIWTRVVALVDDESRAAIEAPESWLERRWIQVHVEGRPPTESGSRSPEQVLRRTTLLAAVRDQLGAGFAIWETPVVVDVRVESGPEGDPSASAGDVVAAVSETLAIERPVRLADRALSGVGLYRHKGLVREGRSLDHFSHSPSYEVSVSRMIDQQVAAMSDPRSYEELIRDSE
ncbi:MAG: DUF6869 domain-containing protein [Candidatus Limnocylindrales bacterium]